MILGYVMVRELLLETIPSLAGGVILNLAWKKAMINIVLIHAGNNIRLDHQLAVLIFVFLCLIYGGYGVLTF